MGKLFYLMGKSASGKDHIYRALADDAALALRPLILYTTRPMRKGETDGREYHFTDEAAMDRLRDAGRIIEERVYQTVDGPWRYATVDDGQMEPDGADYLTIGTLDSFCKLREHYGVGACVPLYIESDDALRLTRAIRREKKQAAPNYAEICRRFLADAEDFSEARLQSAGITERFANNDALEDCIEKIRTYILQRAMF